MSTTERMKFVSGRPEKPGWYVAALRDSGKLFGLFEDPGRNSTFLGDPRVCDDTLHAQHEHLIWLGPLPDAPAPTKVADSPLEWKSAPTVEGQYWWRAGPFATEPSVVYVGLQTIENVARNPAAFSGQLFAGPIPEPEPPLSRCDDETPKLSFSRLIVEQVVGVAKRRGRAVDFGNFVAVSWDSARPPILFARNQLGSALRIVRFID